jgi:hypothetical protein
MMYVRLAGGVHSALLDSFGGRPAYFASMFRARLGQYVGQKKYECRVGFR